VYPAAFDSGDAKDKWVVDLEDKESVFGYNISKTVARVWDFGHQVSLMKVTLLRLMCIRPNGTSLLD